MFRDFIASQAGLAAAIDFVQARCGELGLANDVTYPLCVILDEMIANLMMHGHAESDSQFQVAIAREGDGAWMQIKDTGAPFDPVHWPPVDRSGPGGHGLQIAKGLANRMTHELIEGGNLLTVTVLPKDAEAV